MKKLFVPVLIVVSLNTLKAQDFNYDPKQTWADKPVLHTVNKMFDSASAVALLDERSIEYVKVKDDMLVYETDHVIIKIVNDAGIEMYNKIYIPKYESSQVKNIKARTILPNGKIIELSQDAIKEIQEDGRTYKLFAMDGLEKGCEVEYTYMEERSLSIFGSEVFQRSNVPTQDARFVLITPSFLKFDAKGYNGFEISKDSVIGEERIIAGMGANMLQMEDEKYAFTDPYLQRVDYKLSYNISKNENIRLYTWKDLAKQVYPFYTVRTPKKKKPLMAL